MTQKQILSVQNTETAIPIHHIPTFDEVYAMPYVRESLECILDQNIRQYQILYSFKDDLRQEILIKNKQTFTQPRNRLSQPRID